MHLARVKQPATTATICWVYMGDQGKRKGIYESEKEERQAFPKEGVPKMTRQRGVRKRVLMWLTMD